MAANIQGNDLYTQLPERLQLECGNFLYLGSEFGERCYPRGAMAIERSIQTQRSDVICDLCGRSLLRGEHIEPFLAAGLRRQVCELCIPRAQHEGWIREAGADRVGVHRARERGSNRSIFARVRGWINAAREQREIEPKSDSSPSDLDLRDKSPKRRRSREQAPDGRPTSIHAIPTNAELKMQRALTVFNGSDHLRTVTGVARSLGLPIVSIWPRLDEPSVVVITIMWELSWYRYEVDLSNESRGVRQAARGSELDQLTEQELTPNALMSQNGALELDPSLPIGGE